MIFRRLMVDLFLCFNKLARFSRALNVVAQPRCIWLVCLHRAAERWNVMGGRPSWKTHPGLWLFFVESNDANWDGVYLWEMFLLSSTRSSSVKLWKQTSNAEHVSADPLRFVKKNLKWCTFNVSFAQRLL